MGIIAAKKILLISLFCLQIFRLVHNCACGNGCPKNTLIPSVTRKDVTPAPRKSNVDHKATL